MRLASALSSAYVSPVPPQVTAVRPGTVAACSSNSSVRVRSTGCVRTGVSRGCSPGSRRSSPAGAVVGPASASRRSIVRNRCRCRASSSSSYRAGLASKASHSPPSSAPGRTEICRSSTAPPDRWCQVVGCPSNTGDSSKGTMFSTGPYRRRPVPSSPRSRRRYSPRYAWWRRSARSSSATPRAISASGVPGVARTRSGSTSEAVPGVRSAALPRRLIVARPSTRSSAPVMRCRYRAVAVASRSARATPRREAAASRAATSAGVSSAVRRRKGAVGAAVREVRRGGSGSAARRSAQWARSRVWRSPAR